MDDERLLDEELLDLLQPAAPSPSKRGAANKSSPKKRKTVAAKKPGKRKGRNSDDESDESSDATLSDAESSDFSSIFGDDGDDDDDLDADSDGDDDQEQDRMDEELLGELDESALAGLTELQREALIAEREEKRQQLLEHREIKKRLKQSARSSAPKKDRKLRDSSKAKAQKAKKLQELKAKRSGKKSKLDYEDKDVDVGGSEDNDEDYLSRIRSSYAADGGDSKREENLITVEELRSIQITRDQLEKWVYAPFLEEVVVGLFVRLGIGLNSQKIPQYRVAEVVGVVPYHRIYKINSTLAKVALRLRHGKAEKVFLMDVLSNAPFSDDEFARWIKSMKSEKQRTPSKVLVTTRSKNLQAALHRAYTEKEVSEMVARRQETYAVPTNLSLQRVKLQADLDQAVALEDTEAIERLTRQIADITHQIENPDGEAEKKVDVWAKLNQRNRLQNLRDVSQAEQISRQERIGQLTEKSRTKKSASAAAAKFDPFARIKAAPVHVYTDNDVGEKDSGESTPMDERRRSSLPSLTSPLTAVAPLLELDDGGEVDAFDLLKTIDIGI